MDTINPKPLHVYKTVIIGHFSVGKTSIIQKFVTNKFNDNEEPTIGAAFLTKTIQSDSTTYKYEIWDTAGQERYRTLVPMYYRGAHVALIVFDVTNKDSFNDAKMWIKTLEKENEDFVKILIGNKSDLVDQRIINRDEAIELADKHSLIYYECSAKTGYGIKEIFDCIKEVVPKEVYIPDKVLLKKKKKSFGFCCGI